MAQAMNGDFRQMPENTILIQFADPDKEFPRVPRGFTEIHQFKCWDVTDGDPKWDQLKDGAFTVEQANQLAHVLVNAWENEYNVLVHCVAGLCRSGAVVEILVSVFKYTAMHNNRIPNFRVRRMIEDALYNMGFFDREDCPAFIR